MSARDDYPPIPNGVNVPGGWGGLHLRMCQEIDRLRLLNARLERDFADMNPQRPSHSRHPLHYCITCSDGTQPGEGCFNCRYTGMDQSPCATCSREATP